MNSLRGIENKGLEVGLSTTVILDLLYISRTISNLLTHFKNYTISKPIFESLAFFI